MSSFNDIIMPRFNGIERLYGKGSLEALSRAHVLIVGIGGVGSWAAESLARSAVGRLTLVDLDDVCVSNCNRQLHALDGQVGRQKVDVMVERISKINPACKVTAINDFYTPSTQEAIFDHTNTKVDFVIDAIDSLSNKAHLLAACMNRSIPVVTVGGAGGRSDPTQIETKALFESGYDGLLRMVRKKLRKNHPEVAKLAMQIPCVYSREQPRLYEELVESCDSAGVSRRINCQSGYGTASFVTGTFGMVAAALVTTRIADPKWSPEQFFAKVK